MSTTWSEWQTRRQSAPSGAARLGRNLRRAPGRAWRSMRNWLSAAYRWEQLADASVNRWLSPARAAQLDALEGMSSARECRLLAWLASECPPGGSIVEIGAWLGKSTAWLVEGASQRPNPLPVVSIDPHERGTWDRFQEVVRSNKLCERGLSVHRAYSHDVGRTWSQPVSLLWVDGCHEYDAVVQDIADFTPHVLPGGLVVFDDAAGGRFPGVERAIKEWSAANKSFRREATLRHLQVFKKAAELP